MYEQFAHAIQQKYPDLIVEGDNYPPPPMKAYFTQLLGFVKLALIVLIVSGQNPFTWINMDTPNAYNWALQNKVSVAF